MTLSTPSPTPSDELAPLELPLGLGTSRRLAIALPLALLPVLAALAWFPGFISQDGPAHLYNAQIIARSSKPPSPFESAFTVQWQPLPNWGGHLLYMGAGTVLNPSAAERSALAITFIALACAVAWLRARVNGGTGAITTAAVAALLGMNVTWLFGFTGFTLGAAMFGLTLATWWSGRERMSWGHAFAIATLLVIGYFCHPVSLGLTMFGLALFALGERKNKRTLLLTLTTFLPLIPLVLIYKGLTSAGGPMRPEWEHLSSIFSPSAWATQLGWVDPISLAAKLYRPFGTNRSKLNIISAPVLWLVVGLTVLAVVTIRTPSRAGGRKYWGILAAILIVAGIVGPDTLGESHGHYLPQRIVLLGLVSLVPWLRLDVPGIWSKLGRACVFVALVLQSMFIWDYAQTSDRDAAPYMKIGLEPGRNQRVAAIVLGYQTRFRPNPMLHADCLLGIGTDNIIWGDYETNHYYFPVQLAHPETAPKAMPLEGVTRLNGADNAHYRREIWQKYLQENQRQIDVVLIWGSDPELEAITATLYNKAGMGTDGKTQIWVHKHEEEHQR